MTQQFSKCNNLGSSSKYRHLPEHALQTLYIQRKARLQAWITQQGYTGFEAVREYDKGIRKIVDELGI